MIRHLAGRLAQISLVFLLFLTLVFFLVQMQPGDFTTFYALDPNIPPEARQRLQASFGLDQPVWRQYLTYLGNFFSGDFGISFGQRRPVTEVILERLPRTLMLFMTATIVSFYLGFVLGKIIAWHRGRAIEYVSTISGVYLYTIFTPWFALILIWLFAFRLNWFPLGKFINPILWRNVDFTTNHVFTQMLWTALAGGIALLVFTAVVRRLRLRHGGMAILGMLALVVAGSYGWWAMSGIGTFGWDIARHMVLPVLTLTAISFAGTMLLTRNAMLETLREDYVLAARAKGLPTNVVRDRHVARNAMLPVVTSLVFSLAFAIDGGVITETVFSWPGLGRTLYDAAVTSDLPLAVGAFVFTGVFALIAHVVADILYVFLDPRIRYQ